MITLQNVTFSYNRRKKIFSDLSLTLKAGHIHGLLGCNGIGKSTLLHLICGLLTPDAGDISVDSFQPRQRLPRMFSNLLFVPEEISLPDIPFQRFATLTGAFYPGYSSSTFTSHCSALQIDASLRPRRMSMGERKKPTSPSHWPATPIYCCWMNRRTDWIFPRKQPCDACWPPMRTKNGRS